MKTTTYTGGDPQDPASWDNGLPTLEDTAVLAEHMVNNGKLEANRLEMNGKNILNLGSMIVNTTFISAPSYPDCIVENYDFIKTTNFNGSITVVNYRGIIRARYFSAYQNAGGRTVAPEGLLADINGDKTVNFPDFSIYSSEWLKTQP